MTQTGTAGNLAGGSRSQRGRHLVRLSRCRDVLGCADAAKVEAQGRQAGLQGAFRRVKHHFVVQRASIEGMGMAHDRCESRRNVRVPLKQSLEFACRTVDEQSFEFRKTSSIPNICRGSVAVKEICGA